MPEIPSVVSCYFVHSRCVMMIYSIYNSAQRIIQYRLCVIHCMSIYCSLLCFKNHVIERQQLAIQTIFYIDRRFFWNLSPVTDSDVTLLCLHFAHSCTLPFAFKIQKRGYLVMPREKHASVDIPVSLNFLPTRSGWPHAPLWKPSIYQQAHLVPFVSCLPCINSRTSCIY